MQRMKSIAVDCILNAHRSFLQTTHKLEFELFSFDFLIDEDLRTWLLEVNNNPYLGVPNNFIKDLLEQMINETLEIVLDPLFPP
jgi:D-alanine-D-alanine ligase-like ATP-grasp enzyme